MSEVTLAEYQFRINAPQLNLQTIFVFIFLEAFFVNELKIILDNDCYLQMNDEVLCNLHDNCFFFSFSICLFQPSHEQTKINIILISSVR